MTNPSNIESVVMRRVHTLHVLQMRSTSIALAAAIFVLALWGIGREVWVSHVIQNLTIAMNDGGLARYLEIAFLNTRFIVQVLVVLVIGAVIWLAYNFVQLLKDRLRFA